jgi:hypothetical protein
MLAINYQQQCIDVPPSVTTEGVEDVVELPGVPEVVVPSSGRFVTVVSNPLFQIA